MGYSQLTWRWNGFTGAPGWVRMKFLGSLNVADANTAAANMRTWLTSISTLGPTGSSLSCDSTVGIFGDFGDQTGEISLTTIPSAVTCTGTGAYAGGAGAVVNWLTSAFHAGRKVRGRSFLVPLTQGAFQTDGTLLGGVQTSLQAAAQALATSSPTPVVFSKKGPAGGPFTNVTAVVTGATVPDRTAILRSRRD
jgi:hypothetical protein